MSEHTPTTEQVRGGFASSPMAHEPREYAEAEFDRWLARRDAEKLEKGVRLAAEYLRNEMEEPWGMRFASHLEAHAAGIVLEAP